MSRFVQFVLLATAFIVAANQAAAGPAAPVDSGTSSLLLASLGVLGLVAIGRAPAAAGAQHGLHTQP